MKKSLEKLLKSGDFTLIYWDNGSGSIYKGKIDIGDIGENKKAIVEFDTSADDGYLPDIVKCLVEALGGNCDSI